MAQREAVSELFGLDFFIKDAGTSKWREYFENE